MGLALLGEREALDLTGALTVVAWLAGSVAVYGRSLVLANRYQKHAAVGPYEWQQITGRIGAPVAFGLFPFGFAPWSRER
jgi:hypothetical protein